MPVAEPQGVDLCGRSIVGDYVSLDCNIWPDASGLKVMSSLMTECAGWNDDDVFETLLGIGLNLG